METQCNRQLFRFQCQNHHDIAAKFDGGIISSNGVAMLVQQVEQLTGIISGFADCFTDHRDGDLIEYRSSKIDWQTHLLSTTYTTNKNIFDR